MSKLHLLLTTLLLSLVILPLSVVAWTPPIFMDTMDFTPLLQQEQTTTTQRPQSEQAQNSLGHRELQLQLGQLNLLSNVQTFSSPTAEPTESPAPSPSPSAVPTASPTITGRPTTKPTPSPTESPAPSPSPSAVPTVSPTKAPTPRPSQSPSMSSAPSSEPSTSSPPSSTPTSSPSSMPSSGPSAVPSSAPTYIANVEASYMVDFQDFDSLLAISEQNAFEKATIKYVSFYPIAEGSIANVDCEVYKQVVKTDPHTRLLETDNNESESEQPEKYLQIFFLIKAEYTGTDTTFDLFNLMNPQFQNQNTNWVRGLADGDTIFQVLVPASQNVATEIDSNGNHGFSDGQATLSKSSYLGILFASFFALILAIVASIYAVRSHNHHTFGTELRSPPKRQQSTGIRHGSRQSHLSNQTFFRNQDAMETGMAVTMSTSSDHSAGGAAPNIRRVVSSKQQPNHHMQQQPHLAQQEHSKMDSANTHFARRLSQHSVLEPPPRPHPTPPHIPPPKRKERDPVAHRASEIREPPEATAFSEVNFGRTSSLFDRQSIVSDASTEDDDSIMPPGRISNSMAQRIAKFEKAPSDVSGDPGYEMQLTKSFGGTLGARSVANSVTNNGSSTGSGSDISSQAKAFFDNLVKKTAEQLAGTNSSKNNHGQSGNWQQTVGVVGAGPITSVLSSGQLRSRPSHSDKHDTGKRRGSYDSIMRKPGLYDVFAPPGPIGIVVDTTEHGPVVHSLKHTSPMTGLIEPGDIIIALDDQDTRSFSAATLTRLMASKANQKERKITLLTVDGK